MKDSLDKTVNEAIIAAKEVGNFLGRLESRRNLFAGASVLSLLFMAMSLAGVGLTWLDFVIHSLGCAILSAQAWIYRRYWRRTHNL